MKKNCLIGFISIISCIIFDQITKLLAVTYLKNQPIDIIKGVFKLQYLENRGAAFGMLQNQLVFFIISGLLIVGASLYIYLKLPATKRFIPARLCLILVVAGGIGNMIDRIRLNYVIDFLYFELIDFPIFNVADIYVTVSMFLLVILILFYYTEDELNFVFSWKQRGKKHDTAN